MYIGEYSDGEEEPEPNMEVEDKGTAQNVDTEGTVVVETAGEE